MRTCSGDNPHNPRAGEREWRAWTKHEKAAVTDQDVRDFLCCLWRLSDEMKKATGNSGTLPSGTFAEHVRQIARKTGWAACEKGKGWLLTDAGRAEVTRAKATGAA